LNQVPLHEDVWGSGGFTPGERIAGSHFIGGYGEYGGKEKKIPAPAGNLTPLVQPVAQSLYRLSYLGSYSNMLNYMQRIQIRERASRFLRGPNALRARTFLDYETEKAWKRNEPKGESE